MTAAEWDALTPAALEEWAREHFIHTRPTDTQVRKSAVVKQFRAAGINPQKLISQLRKPETQKQVAQEVPKHKFTPEQIENMRKSLTSANFEELKKIYGFI